jgi:hypothetical protein
MFFIEQDVRVLFEKLAQKHMSYIRTMEKNMYVVLKKHQFNVLLLENWGRNGWWSHWAKHAFHFGYPNTMAKGDDN